MFNDQTIQIIDNYNIMNIIFTNIECQYNIGMDYNILKHSCKVKVNFYKVHKYIKNN